MFDQFDDFGERLRGNNFTWFSQFVRTCSGNDLTCFLGSYVRIRETFIAKSCSLESISTQDVEYCIV